MPAAKDYPQLNDEEPAEEVLTLIEKIKRYWDAALWIKRVVVTLKVLFFGATATVVGGSVVNENFLHDTAVEVGLVEAPPVDTTKGILQEELTLQLATMQQEIIKLRAEKNKFAAVDHDHDVKKHVHTTQSHDHPLPDHDHPFGIHEHAYAAVDHTHPNTATLTPELKQSIIDQVESMLPKDHKKLH